MRKMSKKRKEKENAPLAVGDRVEETGSPNGRRRVGEIILERDSGKRRSFELIMLNPHDLEPIQQGDTFSFKIMESMEPQIIRYHSHLHPEVAGSIMVSHDGPDAGTVKIDIRAMALHPSEVTVRPGTEVIWTNQGAEIQALASGVHLEAKSTSEEKHGEDEERDIGFLEVLPR